MDKYTVFPDTGITANGPVSRQFLTLGIKRFHDACRYVHERPYGYNTDRDDLMILFREDKGTCTTKHSVIATLAAESDLPISKTIGIYAMTEDIVTGTTAILAKYNLPYVPMVHCFLEFDGRRVDLTEGNRNGKNRSINVFLYTEPVVPDISAKAEYRLYRKVLEERILPRDEMKGMGIGPILHAREEGLELLRANIDSWK